MMELKKTLKIKSCPHFSMDDSENPKDFVNFTKTNLNRWMEHYGFFRGFFYHNNDGRVRVQFAHMLLKEAPQLYQTKADEDIDASIHEAIGLDS